MINPSKIALNYRNIILKHKKCVVSSRSECDISTVIAGKRVNSPVICSNMKSVLTKEIARIFDQENWFHVYHRIDGFDDIKEYVARANRENWNFVSPSIGIKLDDELLLRHWKKENYKIDAITIDVAFSYQDRVADIIKLAQDLFPQTYLIVGNGDSVEWIQWLESLKVNCCKVGIGTSSSCRTKQFTGFASSTITDLERCSENFSGDVLSDGGLFCSENHEVWIGDLAKSVRFGADFVMSGSIFSRCIDSPAMKNGYFGNASRNAKGNSHVEGTNLTIETNGMTIKETIKFVEESLRSSVSYAGGTKLMDLRGADYQIVF